MPEYLGQRAGRRATRHAGFKLARNMIVMIIRSLCAVLSATCRHGRWVILLSTSRPASVKSGFTTASPRRVPRYTGAARWKWSSAPGDLHLHNLNITRRCYAVGGLTIDQRRLLHGRAVGDDRWWRLAALEVDMSTSACPQTWQPVADLSQYMLSWAVWRGYDVCAGYRQFCGCKRDEKRAENNEKV